MARKSLEFDICVRKSAVRHLACLHHRGPYIGDVHLFEGLFDRLLGWAGPRGLSGAQPHRVAVFHNDPEITPPDELQMSVGLSVPAGTPLQDGIEALEIPAGTCAVAVGRMRFDRHGEAWWLLMGEWLPRSGWKPAAGCSFEVIHEAPSEEDGMHQVELWVPVASVQAQPGPINA